MNKKRIETFIKEYFYFSQTERKGIVGLLLILVCIITLPSLYSFVFPSKPVDIKIEPLQMIDESGISKNIDAQSEVSFFDPNTATDEELKQLGFTDKNISTFRKYLSKGGKFKEPEDLRKMYGLKPSLVEKLIPFIQINNANTNGNKFPKDSVNAKSKFSKQPLEINSADTSQLIALYRIGPAMARRVVEYRTKLGGFLTLNQLIEIYGFDEDLLYDLNGKIYVDASKAKIHDVNRVTADELKTHPYFKYKLSNAIVNYRTQHGNYKDLSELKKIALVNDSIYQNITKYLMIK